MTGRDSIRSENQGKSGLGFIRPRDTRRVVARSIVYSRIVGVLRWVLPLGMAVVLAALIFLPMLNTETLTKMVAQNIPNLVVENLHLTGMDSSNQPYSLTAAKALQVATARDLVDLEKPQGEVTLNSGTWLSGRALYGRYDQQNKRLWLGGDVEMFHDEGYQFNTSEAQINMDSNTAWGDKPVLIQGGFGEITGQGFKVLNKGTVVVITGHAHARLNLHPAEASDKPSGTDGGTGEARVPAKVP